MQQVATAAILSYTNNDVFLLFPSVEMCKEWSGHLSFEWQKISSFLVKFEYMNSAVITDRRQDYYIMIRDCYDGYRCIINPNTILVNANSSSAPSPM